MNFVKNLNAFGVDGKEVPCVTGQGVPTFDTPGEVGLLYLDEDTGKMYKCIAVNGTKYTWVLGDGKNAYEYAKEAGYTGTEEEWAAMIASGGVHTGDEPPADKNIKLWVDTSEKAAELDGTAAVGQIFMVTEVDAEGKPVKWKAVDLPKGETPDWNANEGESGHILNRTHYVDEKGIVHKLPNQFIDADWMATKEDGGAGKTVFIPEQTVSSGLWSDLQADLVEGNVYAVEVNGVLYRCVCHDDGDGTLYLGNGSLLGDTTTAHNNEPFCIGWLTGTGGAFYTDGTLEAPIGIKVTNWLDVVYNKLPEEFLPENVVKGEGGKVAWDNVSDKPFSQDAGELLFSHTATFATDAAATAGLRITDVSITLHGGSEYWLELNGEMFKCICEKVGTMSWEFRDGAGNMWLKKSLATNMYVYGQTAGTYTYNLYGLSEGLVLDPQYVPPNVALKKDIPDAVVNPATAAVGQTIIVKEVDENGKPTKWKSADYQPRTHWTEEAVLYEDTIVANESNEMLTAALDLTLGKTYKITWNGAEYSCEVKDISELGMGVALGLGNIDVVMETGDTGEPFFAFDIGGLWCFIPLDGATSAEVSIVGDKAIAIPREYLGNAFPYYVPIVDGAGGFTTTETVESLKAVHNSGREIRAEVASGVSAFFNMSMALPDETGAYSFAFYGASPNTGAFSTIVLMPQEDGTYTVTFNDTGATSNG